MHTEAVDPRLVAALCLCRRESRVHLEEDVVEGRSEVGAVDHGVSRGLGVVEVLAARAVELHGGRLGNVGLAHGQEGLCAAHDAGTFSEVGFLELLELVVVMLAY